jgi:hypothetical protein
MKVLPYPFPVVSNPDVRRSQEPLNHPDPGGASCASEGPKNLGLRENPKALSKPSAVPPNWAVHPV